MNGQTDVALSGRTRILVVDDHPIVREGLAQLIAREPDLAVCGSAADARAALEAICALRPDVIIVDISLDGPDGLDLLKTICMNDSFSVWTRWNR